MFTGSVNVSASGNGLADLAKSLRDLEGAEVLVGIPEETSGREGDPTNAQLAFIHTHGVHTAAVRRAIGDNMQMGPGGVPHTPGFDALLGNIAGGMTYSAALSMYIHEHGSAAWRIPPRPIVEPAISDPENAKTLGERMRETAVAALDRNAGAVEQGLGDLAQTAENLVKEWFVNPRNLWAANAASTIARKGSDRPLIDIGALRAAIRGVIRRKG